MSTDGRSSGRDAWTALGVLCLGHLLALLDTTVVNLAIPAMLTDLNASLGSVLWITNAYILAYAVLIVTGGRLGDLFGHKAVYLAGTLLFTAASLWCGVAGSVQEATVARVAQGVGAALLTPQSLAIVSLVFPQHRRGTALGVWGAAAGVAAAAGPTVGGLLVSAAGWRWVFYVNVPLGLLAVGLGWRRLPDLPGRRRHRLDVIGTVLFGAGLLPVVYALIEGRPHGWGALWGPVTAPVLIAGGIAVLAGFVVVERARQDREPLLPFAVFRAPNFALVSVLTGVLPACLGAMLLLVSLHGQEVLGLSAVSTGLLIAVAPLLSVLLAPWSGRLTDRHGGKYVMTAGFGLFAAGLALLAIGSTAGSSWAALLPGLAVFGVGMGVVFSPPGALAMEHVDPEISGAASGVFNMSRLTGSLLGGAAVAALLQAAGTGSTVTADTIRTTYLLPLVLAVLATLASLFVTTSSRPRAASSAAPSLAKSLAPSPVPDARPSPPS